MSGDRKNELGHKKAPAEFYIRVVKDGPYIVYGNPPLDQQIIIPNEDGTPWIYRKGNIEFPKKVPMVLCRCGASGSKPFCDGSHDCHKWDSAETASHEGVLKNAEWYEGGRLRLADNEKLCSFARFCEAKGRLWNIVQEAKSDGDLELAKREAAHCPSGRLMLWDKLMGERLEPDFEPSLSIVEDSGIRVSGPIMVRGGIKLISADNKPYEIRNRMTICRCGRSKNKPFCDGSHADARFDDGLPQTAKKPNEDM